MNRKLLRWLLPVWLAMCSTKGRAQQSSFTLDQVLSAPFNSDLVAVNAVNRLAWSVNQQGRRNIWVAEGESFTTRQLTNYNEDNGVELSDLKFTPDGNAIVFVRGEGKNSAGEYANPTSNPAGPEQFVWTVPFRGGAPEKIDAGHSPCPSAQGKIAYARDGQIYLGTVESLVGKEKPKQVVVRGKNEPIAWSPDGTRLLFVSDRDDHSFIGIYDAEGQSVKFVAASVDRDSDPVWSLDGRQIAFVRQPAVPRDTPKGYFVRPDRAEPWAIWVADTGNGEAHEVWKSRPSIESSYPYMAAETGGGVLNWAADNTLVFASEADGWQHLYSISADGDAARLLTPGDCEVEQWSFSVDRADILFNSNCGDVDRRHIWSQKVNGSGVAQELTKDSGVEWNPVYVGGASKFAYIGADSTHTGQVYVADKDGKPASVISARLPATFPAERLVVPQQVVFHSADGLEIHGQLFTPGNLKPDEKRPALIFLHGGPMRQMLLGWHYMYYYANAYAMNQYLAQRGYVVLAVNYRSGIGYGRAFREAPGRAGRGAAEYQDVVAAGKYLAARASVDATRIGLWGGSYGGYLTALGLGRNSELFAAGVDFHGVHDWPTDNWEGKNISPEMNKLAHDSSPVTAVDTWKSPVLLIHGDDDRNVIFSQTVDLVARLRARGVHVELVVFPDELHDFLLNSNWLKAYQATSDFFDRQFQMPQK
ncbi:MAG TPA: prolyl oligopeptidase family serine peptidase [Candidatus Acidoferrum sp.]|nr:prolyl oligopeptidase family serine peptidase [Candidatus Acidoferrum sp.]